MKRIMIAFSLCFVAGSLLANPRTNKRPVSADLNRQIASYVTYPAVMREGKHAGIVLITFSVSENNRLSKLTVHTANRDLNDDITRQLVGKTIQLADNNPFEIHTVRLHFRQ